MQYSKILLASINVKKKTVDVFDGVENKLFDYKDYILFFANYFDLIPDFIDKGLIFLDSINLNSDSFDATVEYKKVSGKTINFHYCIIKQTEDEYFLSVKEEDEEELETDKMTKAVSEAYIENRAKNNALTKTPYVLVMVDIDNFKLINDEYGQSLGDMILIELVSNAKTILGNKGAIARIGGDRFLIIYDIEDNYDTVHDFLFNLKLDLQDLPSCKARSIWITITLGSAQFPSDGNYELLLLKCQKAIIRGKNKGRDCFVMYIEEKCGKVSLNDKITDEVKKIDTVSTKNDVYSLISSVTQLLQNEKDTDSAVDEAINMIGNYFYIDRISVARLNIKTHTIRKKHIWFNPKSSVKYDPQCNDALIEKWAKVLGNKYYIMIDDTKELPDDYAVKDSFVADHTTATMAFELLVSGRTFGLIRFDMTTGARHWQSGDFQIFMLLSQLFASFFQKNYLKDTNYKTFYLDPKFECYNFTKMFSDAGEKIINSNIQDYTIIESTIRNIIRYRSIIGEKKMFDIVRLIVNVLEKYDCIYGKKHEGPFVIFIEGHNKELVEKIIDDIYKLLDEFTESINVLNLELQTGAYFANSLKDSLIEATGNANLTRVLNKTNDVLYYSEEIKNRALFKTEMLLRIDEALDNNEFLLYLQPKMSTDGEKLIGAEALTRWKYKGETLLFPDQFIPLFEEQGVIDKLDFSVFENVCKYQKELIEEGYTPVPISVNVSRYIVDLDSYLIELEKIRKKYKIDPKLIEIEITEGMFYENSLLIFGFIDKLHKHGYKVSMDDFGAGYSNLVAMAKLNFDVIKFDKSFCLDLSNVNVKLMLDKLIELIKMMKMKTICEGVETKENVDYLTKIGCDSIQGYYYSKPIPCLEFKEKYFVKKVNGK